MIILVEGDINARSRIKRISSFQLAVRFVPKADVSNICMHYSLEHRFHCIAMQKRRNHQGRFSEFWTGKGAGHSPHAQKRAEGLSGGAGKNCYGKCE